MKNGTWYSLYVYADVGCMCACAGVIWLFSARMYIYACVWYVVGCVLYILYKELYIYIYRRPGELEMMRMRRRRRLIVKTFLIK